MLFSAFRTCLHKHMRTSFRQILPQTALKILAGRQPACKFLPCLQQNYARKSAHISYEDRFLFCKNGLDIMLCRSAASAVSAQGERFRTHEKLVRDLDAVFLGEIFNYLQIVLLVRL